MPFSLLLSSSLSCSLLYRSCSFFISFLVSCLGPVSGSKLRRLQTQLSFFLSAHLTPLQLSLSLSLLWVFPRATSLSLSSRSLLGLDSLDAWRDCAQHDSAAAVGRAPHGPALRKSKLQKLQVVKRLNATNMYNGKNKYARTCWDVLPYTSSPYSEL